ncbi:MAG: hypothetical protein V4625_15450 [Pseudomonadota bacterium]
MNFQESAARFEAAESGTDSFKLLYKDAFRLMKEDASNAAFYFVVGVAAHGYVVQYEDQGVSPEFADKAKATLVGFNSKIATALALPPDAGLRLLGEVTADYQFNVHDF